MKKNIALSLWVSSVALLALSAHAEDEHTLSIGFAQSHVTSDVNKINGSPRGINLKYRYEMTDDLGFIASLTHTTKSNNINDGQKKLNYYSGMVGPVYRINDNVSAYAFTGPSHMKTKRTQGETPRSGSRTSAAFGGGVQINPAHNWVVDASYEYTRLGSVDMGTWSLGAGYRF